eukprot:89550-Rhodomonas_salina.1
MEYPVSAYVRLYSFGMHHMRGCIALCESGGEARYIFASNHGRSCPSLNVHLGVCHGTHVALGPDTSL